MLQEDGDNCEYEDLLPLPRPPAPLHGGHSRSLCAGRLTYSWELLRVSIVICSFCSGHARTTVTCRRRLESSRCGTVKRGHVWHPEMSKRHQASDERKTRPCMTLATSFTELWSVLLPDTTFFLPSDQAKRGPLAAHARCGNRCGDAAWPPSTMLPG